MTNGAQVFITRKIFCELCENPALSLGISQISIGFTELNKWPGDIFSELCDSWRLGEEVFLRP
jgi:hypothetical protein